MRLTLVLPEAIATELSHRAAGPVEVGGFLLGRLIQCGDQYRLLARHYEPVRQEHIEIEAPDQMVVTSAGIVPALGLAEDRGDIAIWFHTHPGRGSIPLPSHHDNIVDEQLAETVRIRTGQPFYGALIASPDPTGDGFIFSGHLAGNGQTLQFDRAWVVGDRFSLIPSYNSRRGGLPAKYDRNVRAFGEGIQATLGELKIGVVGCGGTGSAVVEQLARLGVRDFVLIDPKDLTDSNVTRVYGSGAAQVGEAKVRIARENVLRVAPDARVEAIKGDLLSSSTTIALSGCDLVFGCTDDDAGRLVLSRLATFLLCPVIDCGVLISSDSAGIIEGIDGRVTLLAPSSACLICRNRIDTQRAGAQLMSEAERTTRIAEGYAPALGDREPAVVTFTTAVASAAVNELLERLIGYGPTPRPSELLLRFHEREISTNRALPRLRHYCHPESGKWGLGVTSPFLELAWPA